METDDALDELIDAAARALAMPIAPEWKASVRANLAVTLELARLVEEFELPDELDPAPIYEA
jgi:1-carboxybiuret hydrolase subunit AtzG-like